MKKISIIEEKIVDRKLIVKVGNSRSGFQMAEIPLPNLYYLNKVNWYFEEYLYNNPYGLKFSSKECEKAILDYGRIIYTQTVGLFNKFNIKYLNAIEVVGESNLFNGILWESISTVDDFQPLPSRNIKVIRIPKLALAKPKIALNELYPRSGINILVVTARKSYDDIGHNSIQLPLVDMFHNEDNIDIDVLRPGSFDALQKKTQGSDLQKDYSIIHFDLHGELLTYDEVEEQMENKSFNSNPYPFEGKKFFLSFETNVTGEMHPVPIDQIAHVLKNANIPICLFTACYSANTDTDIDESSLAYFMASHGIPVVIGMRYQAHKDMIAKYTEAFYGYLLGYNGVSPQTAHNKACGILKEEPLRTNALGEKTSLSDWVLPVFFQADDQSEFVLQKIPSLGLGISFDLDSLPQHDRPELTNIISIAKKKEQYFLEKNIAVDYQPIVIQGMKGCGKSLFVRYLAWWWEQTNFTRKVIILEFDYDRVREVEILAEILRGYVFNAPESKLSQAVEDDNYQFLREVLNARLDLNEHYDIPLILIFEGLHDYYKLPFFLRDSVLKKRIRVLYTTLNCKDNIALKKIYLDPKAGLYLLKLKLNEHEKYDPLQLHITREIFSFAPNISNHLQHLVHTNNLSILLDEYSEGNLALTDKSYIEECLNVFSKQTFLFLEGIAALCTPTLHIGTVSFYLKTLLPNKDIVLSEVIEELESLGLAQRYSGFNQEVNESYFNIHPSLLCYIKKWNNTEKTMSHIRFLGKMSADFANYISSAPNTLNPLFFIAHSLIPEFYIALTSYRSRGEHSSLLSIHQLLNVVFTQANKNDWQNSLIQTIGTKQGSLTDSLNSFYFNINSLVNKGDLISAIERLQELWDENYSEEFLILESYGDIFIQFDNKEKINEALKCISAIHRYYCLLYIRGMKKETLLDTINRYYQVTLQIADLAEDYQVKYSTLFDMGIVLLLSGRVKEATEIREKLILTAENREVQNINFNQLHRYITFIYIQMDQFDEALEYIDKYLDEEGDHPLFYFGLKAQVYEAQGNSLESYYQYQKALAKASSYIPSVSEQHSNIMDIYTLFISMFVNSSQLSIVAPIAKEQALADAQRLCSAIFERQKMHEFNGFIGGSIRAENSYNLFLLVLKISYELNNIEYFFKYTQLLAKAQGVSFDEFYSECSQWLKLHLDDPVLIENEKIYLQYLLRAIKKRFMR